MALLLTFAIDPSTFAMSLYPFYNVNHHKIEKLCDFFTLYQK